MDRPQIRKREVSHARDAILVIVMWGSVSLNIHGEIFLETSEDLLGVEKMG